LASFSDNTMQCRFQSDQVTIEAPAKVNWYLEVLSRRPDGYHEIETFMVAVSLFDTLTFEATGETSVDLTCSDMSLSVDADNLVLRAASALSAAANVRRGARIHLVKRIPMAAGLAGGSSDAAATLLGLNQLWKLNWPSTRLAELSANLGSDIPFFLGTAFASWCTGRGERVEPAVLVRPMDLVLACPPVGLATAGVYRAVRVAEKPRASGEFRNALETGEPDRIGAVLFNRLQEPAERMCPLVSRLLSALRETNPLGTLMSGSGSSTFALCRHAEDARRVAHELRSITERWPTDERPRIEVVRTCEVSTEKGVTA
jgi:4-diphosphocytidyl-2-C-methyl-D-erythritol kinase